MLETGVDFLRIKELLHTCGQGFSAPAVVAQLTVGIGPPAKRDTIIAHGACVREVRRDLREPFEVQHPRWALRPTTSCTESRREPPTVATAITPDGAFVVTSCSKHTIKYKAQWC